MCGGNGARVLRAKAEPEKLRAGNDFLLKPSKQALPYALNQRAYLVMVVVSEFAGVSFVPDWAVEM